MNVKYSLFRHLTLVTVLSSFATISAGSVPPTSGLQISDSAVKAGAPASYSVSATHYYGFRQDIDPLSVVNLGARWNLGSMKLGLSQSFTKLYFVAPGDQEIQAADTAISLSRELPEFIDGFTPGLFFGATLPVSEYSRLQGVISRPNLALSMSRPLWNEQTTFAFGASGTYHINRYKTTRTGLGAGGGKPMRQYSYSFDSSLRTEWNKAWSASAAVSYVRIALSDVGFVSRGSESSRDRLLNANYSVNLALGYEVMPQLTVNGGYSQSDLVEKTGGVTEAYLFDEYTTQWYMGLASSF